MNNDLEYDAVIEVVSELAIYKEGSLALPFWVKVSTT
jgi:hypothetical protein